MVYETGELKVVAYKNGEKWAEDVVETSSRPAALQLQQIVERFRPMVRTLLL